MGSNIGYVEYERDKVVEDIEHKILVLSGKGGVSKSSIAVNLAVLTMYLNRCCGEKPNAKKRIQKICLTKKFKPIRRITRK